MKKLAATNRQQAKYAISMAGELLAAGELWRRNISTSITYGNAKRADLIVFHESGAVTIEVKSTAKSKWILGNSQPKRGDDIWIFVHIPSDDSKVPRYFIMTETDIYDVTWPKIEAYRAKAHKRKHADAKRRGVYSIDRAQMGEFENRWDIVATALGIALPPPREMPASKERHA